MRRFYTPQDMSVASQMLMCERSYQHWIKVLRAKVGDKAVFFNGLGGEYIVELTDIASKKATIQILEHHSDNRANPYQTTVAIVMSKGDRMDYVLQKSTELGVSHIQLLTSEYCEVKLTGTRLQKKMQNWQGVLASACEQCGLNQLPTLHAPVKVTDYIKQIHQSDIPSINLVLAPETETTEETKPQANFAHIKKLLTPFNHPNQQTSHQNQENQQANIILLIGAEGGLTTNEVTLATQQGFYAWCLGERILRTETAPVVALSYLQCYFSFSMF